MKGTINESRKGSNFIKVLDEDARKEYLIRKIASMNIDQLEPYIKITSHDKHYREIEYEIDIPVNQAQKAEELQAKVDELEKDEGRLERFGTRTFKAYKSLKEENQRYKQALEFYADKEGTYCTKVSDEWGSATAILQDRGEKARQALKGVEDDS